MSEILNRRDHARVICQRVAERIGSFSPPGLGHWEPAWQIVADPSDAFLDALADWIEQDAPATREAVEITAAQLIAAWQSAAQRFRAETGLATPPARECRPGEPARC